MPEYLSDLEDLPTRTKVVIVQGRQFIFSNSRSLPDHGWRIGSVTVDFKEGVRDYVRIYGYQPPIPERKDAYLFEKAVRDACDDPELLQYLFGDIATWYRIRYFNPSQLLRVRGFGTPPYVK